MSNNLPTIKMSPLCCDIYTTLITVIVTVTVLSPIQVVRGQVYEDTQRIFDEVLSSSRYNTDVRPVLNQSDPIVISVSFEILSIVEVNDITQSFILNGIIQAFWVDERARWTPSDYGGVISIHPSPKQIWRPRMVLVNTLGKRDLFEDDYSPMNLFADGTAMWFPGSLFPTSCKLDLTKYPFDQQTCIIRMFPMAMRSHELTIVSERVIKDSYTINGVWELLSESITNGTVEMEEGDNNFLDITFRLARRPTFFLLNVLLPVVLLSFLNIMVFVIPVDSGEKISYGITVSLALTVFMSIVSSLLPQASDTIPHVIVYLFSLLVVSLLTVVVSIFIVFLHHMEVREENSMKHRRKFKSAVASIHLQNRAISPLTDRMNNKSFVDDPLETERSNSSSRPDSTSHPSLHAVSSLLFRQNVKDQHSAKRQSWVDVSMDEEDDAKDGDGSFNHNNNNNNNIDNSSSDRQNKYKTIGKHIDLMSFVVFTLIWFILTLWVFIAIAA